MSNNVNALYRLLLMLAITIMVAACGRNAGKDYDYDRYLETDSIVGSIHTLDSLLAAQKAFHDSGKKLAETMTWRNIGKAYREQGDFTKSLDAYQNGLDLATAIPDTFEIIHAYNGLGTTYRRLGLLDYASENHYKALNLNMLYSLKDVYWTKKSRVIALNGLGNVYLTLQNNHLADSVLRLALQGEIELKSPLGQAINYANLGSIFENNEQTDSAWAYYRMSLQQNIAANSRVGQALCLDHFGHLYEQSYQYDKAFDQYEQAYKLMDGSGDDWHRLNACISLARVSLAKRNIPLFRQYIDEAMATAKRINSAEHLQDAYALLYTYYDIVGDNANALRYYREADHLQDSLINVKKLTDIENMRVELIQSRSKAEIDSALQDIKNERSAKNWAFIIIVVILGLAGTSIFLLFKLLRSRTQKQQMLREMQEVREKFFANVTHELRTPLMVIGGLGERLADGETTMQADEVRHDAGVICRQSSNLLELVNQLLSITRVQNALGPSEWRHGNLSAYLSMMVESYRDYAEEKQLSLKFETQDAQLKADVVPAYIKKIVRNLVGNAMKFTPAGGHVKVSLCHDDHHYQIIVADDGHGMQPEVVAHIFEPFYHSSNDTQASTGIGLVLVNQIAESLKGSVNVETAPGKGSTFTVSLPLTSNVELPALEAEPVIADVLPASMTYSAESHPQPTTQQLQRPTLLIVEDTPDAAYYIATQLRTQYNLLFAANGAEALDLLATNVPDLIVTDLMMPRMDGYEFIRHVRADEQLSHLPVIILTARTTDNARIEGFQAGADAYLPKPFSGDELRLRIDKLLEQRRLLREAYSRMISDTTEHALQAENITASEQQPAPETNVDNTDTTHQLSSEDKAFLTKVNDTIYRLMKRRKVDVETLTGEMCMSRSQFNRRLATLTGMNASGYITEVRLSLARRLLTSEVNMPVSDIAMRCGYEDMGYFSRIFKQVTGMTPTQYRRQIS